MGDGFERISSVNGTTWGHREFLGNPSGDSDVIRDVAFGNGLFLCLNNDSRAFSSTDGTDWKELGAELMGGGSPGWVGGLIHVQGYFWGAGGGKVVRTGDGSRWEMVHRRTGVTFRTLGYGNGTWIAAGDNGVLSTSTDGTNWTDHPAVGEGFQGIAYGKGMFLLVGHGARVTVRRDGEDFRDISVPGLTGVSTDSLRDIAFGGGRFHVVGDEVSAVFDGQTWQVRTGLGRRVGVAYGVGEDGQPLLVSAGGRAISTSRDGLSWTTVFSQGESYRDITFAPSP